MATEAETTAPRAAGARVQRSRWRQLALAMLVVASVLLGSVTIWVGRSVVDAAPDDVTPVRDSLAHLRSNLESGGGEAAQQQFPEGYFFSYALYGLAWTDLAAAGHADAGAARAQARWALEQMESPAGRRVFGEMSKPTFGIFYAGWSLLLRSQAAPLAPTEIDAKERNRISTDADVIATAFAESLDAGGSPFLMAYPNQSWPVDSVVAIAALRRSDRVTGADHGPVIDRWIRRANELNDPRTTLLPHQTDPQTGQAIQGSRGTSQSIIHRMWPIVDPSSAPEIYRRFRSEFAATTAGFVGIREYPAGVDGAADVDSGPLVLGFSASSTAVAIGAARANGDDALATTLLHEADVFGMPLTFGGERRYAFGVVPIGDAFVTWARATPPQPATEQPSMAGRWPFLLVIPWGIVALAWLLVRRGRKRSALAAREDFAASSSSTAQ